MNRMPRASGTLHPPARAWKNIVSDRPFCLGGDGISITCDSTNDGSRVSLLLHEGGRVAATVARAVGLASDAAVRTEQRGDCPHVAAVTGDPDLAGVDGRIASRLVGDEVGALDLVCKHTHHLSLCIIRPVGGLANVYLLGSDSSRSSAASHSGRARHSYTNTRKPYCSARLIMCRVPLLSPSHTAIRALATCAISSFLM